MGEFSEKKIKFEFFFFTERFNFQKFFINHIKNYFIPTFAGPTSPLRRVAGTVVGAHTSRSSPRQTQGAVRGEESDRRDNLRAKAEAANETSPDEDGSDRQSHLVHRNTGDKKGEGTGQPTELAVHEDVRDQKGNRWGEGWRPTRWRAISRIGWSFKKIISEKNLKSRYSTKNLDFFLKIHPNIIGNCN